MPNCNKAHPFGSKPEAHHAIIGWPSPGIILAGNGSFACATRSIHSRQSLSTGMTDVVTRCRRYRDDVNAFPCHPGAVLARTGSPHGHACVKRNVKVYVHMWRQQPQHQCKAIVRCWQQVGNLFNSGRQIMHASVRSSRRCAHPPMSSFRGRTCADQNAVSWSGA